MGCTLIIMFAILVKNLFFSSLLIYFHMKYSANCTVDVANKNNATYLSFGLFLYNNNPVTTKPP